MTTQKYSTLFTFVLVSFLALHGYAQQLDVSKLSSLKMRSIGPAGMSGRVTAIDVVLDDPQVIYVGTASGGLWKSESGGLKWAPVFDDYPVASIGDVNIYQKSPDIIWLGTGEGNPRNSHNAGKGIYRTLDGGHTWKCMGLEKTRNIHRVIIHPDNPNIVYAAAMGSAWDENAERGVYKTTDGGETWEKILYVNAKTGAAEMVMDPDNPNKLIVNMWEYLRLPWFFESGGEGSGLYITYDGGKTWEKRTDEDGLPKGKLGRMGLAISPANTKIVYALIEAKKNALYKSQDGGFTWSKVSDKDIGNRPFYYAEIHADPKNENTLYNLYSLVSKSEDGGRTFEVIAGWSEAHPDHHAFWIHPENPDYLIDGNDGGLSFSYDGGKTWRFVRNLPIAQYYHINVDNEHPYNVYGGMQDNGSWYGPAYLYRRGGIQNSDWNLTTFGDGFDMVPDPNNSRFGYSMWQGGNLVRYDRITGHTRYIQPVHPDTTELRFSWNAAIAVDPHNGDGLYFGSQFLHKSTNDGADWEIISPDLTTNNPEYQKQKESGGLTPDVTGAENFTTISAISPSPLDAEIIWVGTDDGNVQVTTDGGLHWKNTNTNFPDIPKEMWVNQVHASGHNPAEAFVVFDNHRKNDWTPYLFRTQDYGNSWQLLSEAEDSIDGYALSFVQDLVEPKLMFLGTEFGLYISIDEGQRWSKFNNGFPNASTMDMVIHPEEHDLVVGTFGRSAYILDELEILRSIASEGISLLDSAFYVFDIQDAYLADYKSEPGELFPGAGNFTGQNRKHGASFYIIVNSDTTKNEEDTVKTKESKKDTMFISITNELGDTVRNLFMKVENGFQWYPYNLRQDGIRMPRKPKNEKDIVVPPGIEVLPGWYTAIFRLKDTEIRKEFEVKLQPDMVYDLEKVKLRNAYVDTLYKTIRVATESADLVRELKKKNSTLCKLLKDKEGEMFDSLKSVSKSVKDSLQTLEYYFIVKESKGIVSGDTTIAAMLASCQYYLTSAYDEPSETFFTIYDKTKQKLRLFLKLLNGFVSKEWEEYKALVKEVDLITFDEYETIELK